MCSSDLAWFGSYCYSFLAVAIPGRFYILLSDYNVFGAITVLSLKQKFDRTHFCITFVNSATN